MELRALGEVREVLLQHVLHIAGIARNHQGRHEVAQDSEMKVVGVSFLPQHVANHHFVMETGLAPHLLMQASQEVHHVIPDAHFLGLGSEPQ